MADIQLIQCKNQHCIKTVSGKVVAQSIAFRVVSKYWQGDDPFPLKSWLQVTYVLRCPSLPQNGDKVPEFVVFWTISTIKDEKSAAKFHYIKNLSGSVVAQSIGFRVVSIYWLGVAPFPWYLNAKGSTRIGSTCVVHTSPHSAAAVTSLHH